MNIHKRFWPVDNTNVNRMFPGYDKGETTQRVAADIFEAVSSYEYGIQLARFLPARKLTRSNQRASRRAGARATRARAAEALGKHGRNASDSGSASS